MVAVDVEVVVIVIVKTVIVMMDAVAPTRTDLSMVLKVAAAVGIRSIILFLQNLLEQVWKSFETLQTILKLLIDFILFHIVSDSFM